MKGETQVTDILSLGNQKVYLSESVTRQGYFYKIRRSQSKKQLPVHYLFMIDVSKPMNAYRIEIQKALEWAFKYLSKQSSHQISIIVFYGKKNIKWIFKEVNSHELISLIGDINSFLDEELTPYSNSSLINTLESVMSQLDSRFYNHLIVISSGSFQLIDYELDLKQARFQKVTSLFNELSMKLDVLNLGELISSNFYQWVSILNQKAHVYSCFKKMELKFYLNKILRGQRVNLLIDSNDFFLCQKKDFVRKENPIEIEVLDEELIVVFDKPLKIEQKVLDYSTQVLSQDFDYFVTQYCLYLLENQLIQQVSNILSHYGQLGWVKDMSEAYTSSEIIQVMKSFANHRKLKKENSLCLLTLLELIRQDQQSVLLWNRYEDYVPILFRTKVIDSQFQFQEIETDFYVVNQLVLGSRKFNVGLKVKVEGHVEELKTGLKLEAYRFKTYTILLDGVLKIKELYCVLSPSLKKQCQKLKLLKRVIQQYNREICVIDLTRIPITHHDLYKNETCLEVGQMIYEIERLKCWQSLLKEMIVRRKKQIMFHTLKEIDFKEVVKRKYQITSSGRYVPKVMKVIDGEEVEFYMARILEWKVEGFPKEMEKERAYEYIMNRASVENRTVEEILSDELQKISQHRDELQHRLNLIRISVGLRNLDFFQWNEEREVVKTQMDSRFKLNTVLNGKMKVSIQAQSAFKIRQNTYTVLIKRPVLVEDNKSI